ncbi:MAG: hypothetical protein JO269_11370 [Burkholderiaceae bacterium]|nr:hypothetical protein [Burkholderiaceae bacterium]
MKKVLSLSLTLPLALLLALLLLLALPASCQAAEAAQTEDDYVLATRDPSQDPSQNYLADLLRAALEASKPQYGPYKLSLNIISMQRLRARRELEDGQLINVNVQVTSPDWEQYLIPVRIPVDKGITNYRISLIDGRRQDEFSRVKTLDQLRKFTLGVGEQWATHELYEQNRLPLLAGNSNSGLAGMLMQGRFDYYPRSLEEAVREEQTLAPTHPNIAMDKALLLYVPLPRYYFVSPRKPRLAQRLTAGLEALIASGEYDRIFLHYYGPRIVAAQICKRTVLQLQNPSLSPETPLKRRALWFDPSSGADRDLACGAKSAKTVAIPSPGH